MGSKRERRFGQTTDKQKGRHAIQQSDRLTDKHINEEG